MVEKKMIKKFIELKKISIELHIAHIYIEA